VEEALLMALGWRNPIEELMHHSDRGSQYTSLAYQALLAQYHLQVSMSGKGDCYDNAMMESFTSIAQNRVCESASLSEPCRGQTIHL
jgi:transposase InsO family protein